MRVAVATKESEEIVEILAFIRELEYVLVLNNLDRHPMFKGKHSAMQSNIRKIETGLVVHIE